MLEGLFKPGSTITAPTLEGELRYAARLWCVFQRSVEALIAM